MSEEKLKQAERHLTKALAEFAEAENGSPEQEKAKAERVKAEQEMADARKAAEGQS